MPETPSDYNGRVKRMVEVDKRIDDVKAELAVLDEERETLAKVLLLDFEQAGRSRDTIDGRTVYMHRDKRPVWKAKTDEGKTDWPALVAAFREAGLDGFVTGEKVNWQQVRSYLNELADGDLPPSLEGLVELDTEHSIRVRGR